MLQQDATPCLARRLVRKKSVPCSRLAHNANERDSGKDLGSYRLCSDVAVLLQPPTADSTGGGCDRTGGFARYSMMRGHKQGEARCPTEQEPEPEPVHYAWHLRLRPKISPLSHSFSEGHKGRFGLLRQEREHEDESDKRIPKVAQGTRLQHTAFKSKSFSKGTSDATASADVSLGFVTHCTHFRMGLLNVNASPEALQTIDDITVSLPNDACSVEGCLDHLRAMTKDHREAPLSFAFYGLHQVAFTRFVLHARFAYVCKRTPTSVYHAFALSCIDISAHAQDNACCIRSRKNFGSVQMVLRSTSCTNSCLFKHPSPYPTISFPHKCPLNEVPPMLHT